MADVTPALEKKITKKFEGKDCGYVGGISFLLFIFLCAYLGVMLIWIPVIPLIWIAPELFRQWRDFTGGSWLAMCAAYLELVIGIKFIFSGDQVSPNEKALMISNHRVRLDWMFLWSWFGRFGRLSNEKIVLKAPLKWLPGPGWATQLLCFLFLNRNWEEDCVHMENWINYFKNLGYPLQMLLFPEGTDLSKGNLGRSHKYSEKAGLAKYDFVLHPRVKGFTFFIQQLREPMDAIYDATLGYPVGIAEGETDLLKGRFPAEIHIHLKRYSMSEMPTVESEIDDWVKEKWEDKEATLAKFYTEANLAKKDNKPIPGFSNPYGEASSATPQTMIVSLVCWIFALGAAFYLIFNYSFVRWYILLVNIIFVVLTKLGISFDHLEVNAQTQNKTKKKQ